MPRRFPPQFAALTWILGLLLLSAIPSPAQQPGNPDDFQIPGNKAEPFIPGDKNKDKPKHITFKATIRPTDPFSDLNQSNLPANTKFGFQRGDTFTVVITATPEKGWHSFPLTKQAVGDLPGKPSELTITGGNAFQPIYPVEESEPQWKDDKKLEQVYLEHDHAFTWSQDIYVKPDAPVGQTANLMINIKVQVCDKQCVDEEHSLQIPIRIESGDPFPVDPALAARLKITKPKLERVSIPDQFKKGTSTGDASAGGKPSTGILGSIGIAIIGGFVSLLTPCVFPMIPITVSYFLKQSESHKSSAVMMALLYSGTIVVVLTAGGLALLKVLVLISTHYITNFAIGAIFLFFALSLLGWYDITLPSWLQDMTASREGQGGIAGTIFMALTFSIISFACVGPIYGGFISLEASGQNNAAVSFVRLLLPVLAYSIAFASPFFLLALFPTVLRTMPRAGSWMNSVKVVMGFLELAAVIKFVRAGELALTGRSELLTYDLSLGMYVAISLASGLYLLGLYRLPHDHDAPESISVLRLLFSLGFITLGLYLMPGIFKDKNESQRPRGTVFAWVDSFLLPDPEETPGWHHNLKEALAEAKEKNKLLFVDFTGTLCTNCKLNERNIFPRREVTEAMNKHVRLKLYTDTAPAGSNQVPNEADAMQLRNERFKSEALPIYALIKPVGENFEIVAIYNKGLIEVSDIPKFIAFLQSK